MATQSAFSLFKPSKDAVLKNKVPFLVLVFLPSFLILVGDVVGGTNQASVNNFGNPFSQQGSFTVFHAIGVVASLFFLPAAVYLELQAAKGKSPDLNQTLGDSMRYFWRLLGLLVVTGAIVLVGLVALIVPGIIFIQRYFLAPYFLIDRDLGIKKALSASAAASKGHAGAIWGVIGVMILLSLFGLIPIIGGLISMILLTLYTCAPALRYQEMKNSHSTAKAK